MLFSVVSLPTMIEVQLTNEEKLDQIESSGLDLITLSSLSQRFLTINLSP